MVYCGFLKDLSRLRTGGIRNADSDVKALDGPAEKEKGLDKAVFVVPDSFQREATG